MHTLALALHRTVKELLETTTASELTDWLAYMSIFPTDIERNEISIARLTNVVANLFSREPIPLEDFLPDWGNIRAKKQAKKVSKWQQRI